MKNRINKTYLRALCAGALLLSACTKDDTTGLPEYSDTQITAQAQLPGLGIEQEPGFKSRAVADPTQAMELYFVRADETGPDTGTFGAYGTTVLPATRAAGSEIAPLTFTTPQYYIANNARSRFTGWWPAATSFTGGVVSWTLDGSQDVLTAVARDGNIKAPLRNFVFEHKLSKLQFEVVASDAGVVTSWGTISAVDVLAQPTTCTYTLSTGAATGAVALSGSTTYGVKNFTSGALTTTATAKGDPMLVAPATTNLSLTLQVVSSIKGTVAVTVPARTYEAGKAYKLTLSFKGTQVAVTVVPWNDATTDDELGSMSPIYLSDNPNDSPFGISPKLFESKGVLKWQNTPSFVGATDEWDGKANTAKMTDSPAADYCRAMGSNWYIPSHAQMMLFHAYNHGLPASEQLTVGTFIPYWTSTEWILDNEQVWVVQSTGECTPAPKTATVVVYVRCICDGPQPATSYPKVETGNTIVSRDDAGGIKAEAILTPDQQIWLLTTNTTTTQYNEASPYNRVAAKFQVAAVNAQDVATAEDAYTACANYSEGSYGAGLWRLPTQREAALMWAMKDKLTATAITSTPAMFWSSTYSAHKMYYYWQVYFIPSQGEGVITAAYDNASARCVRDGAIPPPPKIGDFKDNGVVYWIDPADPKNYKVVSVTETTLAWACDNNYVIGSGAQSATDGKGNAAAIKAAFDNKFAGEAITQSTLDEAFPAAAYCYGYQGKDGTDAKGTWYIPAKNDLQYLWCAYNGKAPISWESGTNTSAPADASAQAVFNKYLTDAGGVDITSYIFWTSTEDSTNDSKAAWALAFVDGETNTALKVAGVVPVRCIREK